MRELQPVTVMKFGGASLADVERIAESAVFVKDYDPNRKKAVVVSAAKGVTDSLNNLADSVGILRKGAIHDQIDAFVNKHRGIVDELHLVQHDRAVLAGVLFDAREHLGFYTDYPSVTPAVKDEILSVGEYVSSQIFAAALRSLGIKALQLDAEKLIRTDETFGNAAPDLPETERRINQYVIPHLKRQEVPVIPGFYGATRYGSRATLGRNASDYSAALVAYALESDKLVLCKGVDGVYDRNPMIYNDAQFLPEVSYEEATELALNGGKVIYHETMTLCREKLIPIYVMNSNDSNGRYSVVFQRQS